MVKRRIILWSFALLFAAAVAVSVYVYIDVRAELARVQAQPTPGLQTPGPDTPVR